MQHRLKVEPLHALIQRTQRLEVNSTALRDSTLHFSSFTTTIRTENCCYTSSLEIKLFSHLLIVQCDRPQFAYILQMINLLLLNIKYIFSTILIYNHCLHLPFFSSDFSSINKQYTRWQLSLIIRLLENYRSEQKSVAVLFFVFLI